MFFAEIKYCILSVMNNAKDAPDKQAATITSKAYGDPDNTITFNIDLIAEKNPIRAAEILELYFELKDITQATQPQPDEQFDAAADKIRQIMKRITN